MRHPRAWRSVILLTVFVTVVALAGYPVYVDPQVDLVSSDAPADAVVALGGMPESGARAQQVFEQGLARELVLSNPYGRAKNVVTRLCKDVAAGATSTEGISCFVPEPSTTRGEAMEIARLAEARGWRRIVVVAPTFHLSRARMIVERCYSGGLLMVDAQAQIGLPRWVFQYGYQTAGYVKAVSQGGC